MKTHTKFTANERELLANYLASGKSKPACSRLLCRPLTTVKAEVRRNGSWVLNCDGQRIFVYIAITAQAKAESRQRHSAHNKQALKNPDVYQYVAEHLMGGWSPEQIEGRLKKIDHPGDPHWQITHETIYEWVYREPQTTAGRYWYEYLRRKQKKRKKQKGRTVHRVRIPDRVSISMRPEAVNNRTEFGHWEGDSIEGKRGLNHAALHTEVKRMSRLIKATKVKHITSQQAFYAQCRIFGAEPPVAVKSTTLDNGRETHDHYKLRSKFKMMTYHAHPYSSWERGTNEHGNWHLRYYFPKGTDFKKVTRAELQAVVDEINNRPREILGFKTASEVYYQLLEKGLGVRFKLE
jgi:IS30 family transposase